MLQKRETQANSNAKQRENTLKKTADQVRSALHWIQKKYPEFIRNAIYDVTELAKLQHKPKRSFKCSFRVPEIPEQEDDYSVVHARYEEKSNPKSKAYVPIPYNFCFDRRLTVEDLLAPNTLDTPTEQFNLEINSVRKIEMKAKEFVIHFLLKFVLLTAKKYDPIIIQILSSYLQTSPVSLQKISLKTLKAAKQSKLPKNEKRKIYPSKYNPMFCSICDKYCCNYHFQTSNEQIPHVVVETINSDNTHYFTRSKASPFIFLDEKLLTDSVHVQCGRNKIKNCAKQSHSQQNIIKYMNDQTKKWSKVLREIIKFTVYFQCYSPCLVAMLFKYSYQCDEIEALYLRMGAERIKRISQEVREQDKALLNKIIAPVKQKGGKEKEVIGYIPCFHVGRCSKELECSCIVGDRHCERYCCCQGDCKNYYKAIQSCNCAPGRCLTDECPCIKNWRECDPSVCLSCNSMINPRLSSVTQAVCRNNNLIFLCNKRLILGASKICEGMGIFAGKHFTKGEYLGEYRGETLFEDDLRAVIHTAANRNYLFTLIADKKEYWANAVDAFDYGNKTRFFNHAIEWLENVEVRNMFVGGNRRIGFFAKKEIKLGDEMLFNYSDKYNLPWMKEFNRKIKAMKQSMLSKARKKVDLFEEIKGGNDNTTKSKKKPKRVTGT